MSQMPDASSVSQSANSELKMQVLAIVADVLQVETNFQVGNLLRSDTASWDSVNHLRLALELEDAFDITLSDEHWLGLNSVDEIVALLATQKIEGAKATE